MVKIIDCSFRGLEFGSQCWGLTIVYNSNPRGSHTFHYVFQHQLHTWCTYIHVGKALMHIKYRINKSKNKILQLIGSAWAEVGGANYTLGALGGPVWHFEQHDSLLLSCKECVTSSSIGATLKLLTMILTLTSSAEWAFLSWAKDLSWMDYPCHWHLLEFPYLRTEPETYWLYWTGLHDRRLSSPAIRATWRLARQSGGWAVWEARTLRIRGHSDVLQFKAEGLEASWSIVGVSLHWKDEEARA